MGIKGPPYYVVLAGASRNFLDNLRIKVLKEVYLNEVTPTGKCAQENRNGTTPISTIRDYR